MRWRFEVTETIATAVNQALARNEVEAERLANRVRLLFLCAVAALALINSFFVTKESNRYNFGVLGAAFLFGGAVFVHLKTRGYRPALKYITSFADVTMVHILLLLYTLDTKPEVALKNPIFYVVYPLIALTLFRCHPRLTALTGWYTVTLYCGLFACVASRVPPVWGDYMTELFGDRVTVVGQLTKVLILIVYILMASYLARYARVLLHRLVRDQVTVRGEKEAMERELELASQVQAQLLPGEYPQVEGLRLHGTIIEGRFVGGDYYDFIKLSAHSVLLLVGDVSGKGVPAALIMAGVRASVRLSASTNASLVELVLRLNEMLYESTHAATYLTLFAAEIDVAAGSVRYVNAGHPPPLLHAADGIHALASGTIPLGLFPALPGLRAHCEPFPPGSLLVACTDGVSERSNPAGEFYGIGSLKRFVERNRRLDCPDFAGALLDEVRQFGANTPLEDDLTLALARFDAV
jgi:hypothetical protein